MDKISLSKFRRLLNKRMLQARFKPVKSFGIRPKCLTEGRSGGVSKIVQICVNSFMNGPYWKLAS